MSIKVAINGCGRIGRQVIRAIYEYQFTDQFQIVAVNGSGDLATNAHLLQFDTVHGRFSAKVEQDGRHLIINGDSIPFFATRNPARCRGANWVWIWFLNAQVRFAAKPNRKCI